jgi:type IV secretory pathway VirB10-like protein
MREYLIRSAILHVAVIVIIILSGLSFCQRKDETTPESVTVDLAPLGVKTNVKPAPKKEKTPPPTKQEKKQQEKVEEVVEKKIKEDFFDKLFPSENAAPTPEPEKPKPEPEPIEEAKEQQEDELESLLKNLQKKPATPQTESEHTENTDENSQTTTPFDPNQPLTVAEIDYIRSLIMKQIIPCWNIPAGARDAGNLKITMDIDVERDGRLKFIGFVDEERLNYDTFFQVAAESAQRAVLDPRCNPLRELPPMDKFDKWHELTLTFDPSRVIY